MAAVIAAIVVAACHGGSDRRESQHRRNEGTESHGFASDHRVLLTVDAGPVGVRRALTLSYKTQRNRRVLICYKISRHRPAGRSWRAPRRGTAAAGRMRVRRTPAPRP